MIVSHINSLGFLYIFCFYTRYECSKRYSYTIRIGSSATFLYFDLYLYYAYAAHYVYFNF